MLAAYIKSRGGVVTAEEVVPFLPDPGAAMAALEGRGPGAREDIVVRDEAPVLEAVTRFGGKVDSDGEGNLVYVFPELQATAGKPSSSEKGKILRSVALSESALCWSYLLILRGLDPGSTGV